MNKRAISVRDLARQIGLSKATVANALNGSPTVAAATRQRVHDAALRLGYKRNPMVGAFMSAIRRSQDVGFHGTLATVEVLEPERPKHGPFHQGVIRGCMDAATEHGFKLDSLRVEPSGVSYDRLNSILKARGIRGVIILPAWRTPEFERLDWSFLTGVYTDYIPETPLLNSVCCDHYRSLLELLKQLELRGYRRPGVVLEKGRDERVHWRTLAALRTFQGTLPDAPPATPLISDNLNPSLVSKWLKKEKPDVVLSHDSAVLTWIKASRFRVPEKLGYVCLNRAKTSSACAALNLHPDQIGRCAVEILIAQIQRQAWGMPRFPTNTVIIGEFEDGETIRGS